jgi:hypothetical protein
MKLRELLMKQIVSGFAMGLLVSACAGSIIIPKLASRTLEIHDSGKLVYKYCLKRKIFSRKCKKWKEDFYDIQLPEIRAELKNFNCASKFREF